MRWIIEKAIRREVDPAIAWAKAFLAGFETSRVDWMRIDTGRRKCSAAYGRCWYPTGAKGYRISVQVPGPFPYHQTRYTTPLYRDGDGNWPPVPGNCQAAGLMRDPHTGREWLRLTTQYEMRSRVEAVVHVAAHEFFHFLRHSRQIPGRNVETEADRFAVDALANFRKTAASITQS